MPLSGLAWQTLPDAGALALVDTSSRRAAALARPHPRELPMIDVVDIERLVVAWLSVQTRFAAEQQLVERVEDDPHRTMTALSWLLAMWTVTIHLRTGRPPAAVVAAMTYRQVWRSPEAPNSERVWETLTDRIRLGTLAALTSDAGSAVEFRAQVDSPRGMAAVMLRHALGVMASLAEDMRMIGVDPQDMAGTLALYTIDPDGPTAPCFRPLA
ncbi:hypothetical protein CcI49_27160 [Frankia sp. CcI49]|uniref:hypothetical protein n=1 Tax=unclassified Frankia TaxID=2632575 RepID=UPI0006CA2455|nr:MULTISPECIES: hypothetical protein [unclassified Frankia]KPM55258.1 hypothetical protein ACG83_16745 [Frankia sp. R43]ONH56315.1 hypothetical protein CcI49_27160 [Frankia sp. CcI49]